MSIRLLASILLVAAFGLSACGKSEEPAQGQSAPQTGAAQQGKPASGAPEQPAAPKPQ